MALNTGTHDVSSTLRARLSSIPNFEVPNLDRIVALVKDELFAHNTIMDQLIGELAAPTDQRYAVYGTAAGGSMIEADEYSRAPTQRAAPGEPYGIPLRKFQYAVGFTSTWFKINTPADLAVAITAAETADRKRVAYEIKRSLFLSANYTFNDHLLDNGALAVKRLVNADSASIPTGPNGESYDGATHTHYNGYASLTAANMLDNINDVVEHGHGGNVRVYINTANEAAVRALTGFTAYIDRRLTLNTAANQPEVRLDQTRLDNRAIGIFGAAEVWVKPWVPASYQFAFDLDSPKPLWMRQRTQGALQGLQIAGENPVFPLLARFFEREVGFGVYTRTNGALGYFANATFADPTLTVP